MRTYPATQHTTRTCHYTAYYKGHWIHGCVTGKSESARVQIMGFDKLKQIEYTIETKVCASMRGAKQYITKYLNNR